MSIKKYLICAFIKILPFKGRRTILLTTLFMKLNDIKPGNLIAMQEFNNNLHIVDDVQALKLPCHLYKLLWDETNFELDTICNESIVLRKKDIAGMAYRIVSESKLIKKTDDKLSFVEDIKKIIDFSVKRHCHIKEGNIEQKTAFC